MEALSKLREPVDDFFNDVLVNDEDKAILPTASRSWPHPLGDG